MDELRDTLAERVPLSVNDIEAKVTAARAARRAEDAATEAAYLDDDDTASEILAFDCERYSAAPPPPRVKGDSSLVRSHTTRLTCAESRLLHPPPAWAPVFSTSRLLRVCCFTNAFSFLCSGFCVATLCRRAQLEGGRARRARRRARGLPPAGAHVELKARRHFLMVPQLMVAASVIL